MVLQPYGYSSLYSVPEYPHRGEQRSIFHIKQAEWHAVLAATINYIIWLSLSKHLDQIVATNKKNNILDLLDVLDLLSPSCDFGYQALLHFSLQH